MFRRFRRPPASLDALLPLIYTPEIDYEALFWNKAPGPTCRRVLEVGTLQSVAGVPTHSRARFPDLAPQDYVRLDRQAGADVDVTGDVHRLPEAWSGAFDAFLALAVWEHLERPWIAAREVARVLAPGGRFLIVTHQTFPLHGYPSDFFRFSREALRLLFEDAGLIVEACDYKHRSMIVPPPYILPRDKIEPWNREYSSFIHVGITGRKQL